MRSSRSHVHAAGAAVLCLLATACGGGSDTASTTSTQAITTVAEATPSTTSSEPTSTTVAGPEIVDELLTGGSEADWYTYEISIPQLRGLGDSDVQAAVNDEIRAQLTSAIDRFETQVTDLEGPPGPGPQTSTMGNEYKVARVDVRLLSISMSISRYFAGAAHPGANLVTFNHDLGTGMRLVLADLFTDGVDYLPRLTELSRQLLTEELGDGALPDFVIPGTEPEADNFRGWTVTEEELVIRFGEYQVAPYAAGMPEIRIPFASIRTLLDPRGPVRLRN